MSERSAQHPGPAEGPGPELIAIRLSGADGINERGLRRPVLGGRAGARIPPSPALASISSHSCRLSPRGPPEAGRLRRALPLPGLSFPGAGPALTKATCWTPGPASRDPDRERPAAAGSSPGSNPTLCEGLSLLLPHPAPQPAPRIPCAPASPHAQQPSSSRPLCCPSPGTPPSSPDHPYLLSARCSPGFCGAPRPVPRPPRGMAPWGAGGGGVQLRTVCGPGPASLS